jgi:hypothetical protein
MKNFPQLLTIVGLLCLGGLLSQVRDAVEPQAVASSKTAVVSTQLDGLDSLDFDCNCGPDCKCSDETKNKLAELQAKYDAMLAEQTKTASFKASTGNGSSGGSTGKTAQVSTTSTGHYETVVSSSGGGSTGKHPVATAVGKTVQTASNVVKGTVNVAARVATAPVANYRARFTYPGTIEQHLQTDHNVSVSGMSRSEMLAHHDAIHDVIGPVYQSQSTRYSSSNCPGGVCPSGNATASRPRFIGRLLFRR